MRRNDHTDRMQVDVLVVDAFSGPPQSDRWCRRYTRRHASSPEDVQSRQSRRTPEKEKERTQRSEARHREAGAPNQEAR